MSEYIKKLHFQNGRTYSICTNYKVATFLHIVSIYLFMQTFKSVGLYNMHKHTDLGTDGLTLNVEKLRF